MVCFSTTPCLTISANDSIIHAAPPALHNATIERAESPLPPRMNLSDVKRRDDLAKAISPALAKPDFAFPATVASNARVVYDEAMETNHPVTALRAAMQWYVAEQLITSDSIPAAMRFYDRLQQRLPQPYASLAALLKARLLSDLYLADRYTFDSRTLAESADDDPRLWSGDMLKSEIRSLTESAMRQQQLLTDMPISDIAPLIDNASQAAKAGMTAFDFVCYRVADLLRPFQTAADIPASAGSIPFVRTDISQDTPDTTSVQSPPRLSSLGVIDTLIEADSKRGKKGKDALFAARLQRLQLLGPAEQKSAYMKELLDIYSYPSPKRPLLVSTLLWMNMLPLNYPVNICDTYRLVQQTVDDYPKSDLIPYLKDQLEYMRRPAISIGFDDTVLPGECAKVTYSLANARECYLLLVSLQAPHKRSTYLMQKSIPSNATTRVLKHITSDLPYPFILNDTILSEPLAPGYYTVIPSASPSLAGRYPNLRDADLSIINVSDCSAFVQDIRSTLTTERPDMSDPPLGYLYVTDCITGAPERNVTVKFCTQDGVSMNSTVGFRDLPAKFTTDDNGRVPIYYRNSYALIKSATNQIRDVYIHSAYAYNPKRYVADVLTDLALYHPGDSLKCVAVVAANRDNLLSAAKGVNIVISLFDANNKEVDKISAITDDYGRATADLAIPREGLTGSFRVSAILPGDASIPAETLGSQMVEVADYKAPTFRITVDETSLEDDSALISGNVMTYSGMPLANTEVTLDIRFNRRWWRWYPQSAANLPSQYSAKVSTDAQGRFALPLGLANLYGTPYEDGYFSVSATATSPDGETQQGNGTVFAIADGLHISLQDMTLEAPDGDISIPVSLINEVGVQVVHPVDYRITACSDGHLVTEGTASSPTISIPASLLPSGQYVTTVALPGVLQADGSRGADNDSVARMTLTLWRRDDTRPPMATPLWIPESQLYAGENADSVPVTVGSAYKDSHIFYQVADCDSVIASGWIVASESNTVFNAPTPKPGAMVTVTFRGEHNLDARIASVNILPAARHQRLSFITDTFRDRITPRSQESWRFRLVRVVQPGDSVLSDNSAVIAVLSNSALNAITPFEWTFNPSRILSYPVKGSVHTTYNPFSRGADSRYLLLSDMSPGISFTPDPLPAWNFWGQTGKPMFLRNLRIRGSRESDTDKFRAVVECAVVDDQCNMVYAEASAGNMMMKSMATESVADADLGAGTPADEGVAAEEAGIPLRDTTCPLAFFKPLLATDADGVADISFEVPDFNTTWTLQLVGYDRNMLSASLRRETVAAKPVMISTNMPRFLLTGDKGVVAATMFNNSGEPIDIHGTIEIFDIASGKVLARGEADAPSLAPAANAPVSVKFDVPAECQALGVRAIAKCDAGSDGEQQMIQVLPSSQPVAEATSFYLLPSQGTLTVDLPKMGKDDKVTLNYCSNPAWYVLTSLSGLIEADSESALCNLNALYATSVASGLIRRYPDLRKGIESLYAPDGDAALLTSPLEKNGSLKIASLNATPWVNDAESETARMHSLSSLTDSVRADAVISASITQLLKNQKGNGGFAWMPQMDESLWISLNVVDCAARISESGYQLKDKRWRNTVNKTLAYTDATVAKAYQKTVTEYKSKYPLESEIRYFLNRSILGAAAPSGWLKKMHSDMATRLPAEWRNLSIADKAAAARMLHRMGNDALAREILRSVREFASCKPDKGMWFDNLKESWHSLPPKVVTADCLIAFNEVMPGDSAIMEMCRYLVLSRQGEDWNVAMTPAAVTATVNAVLASDLGWTSLQSAPAPRISIDGKEIPLPSEAEALTGNIYLDLSPRQASGKRLEIVRQDGVPAWGAVLRQYVAPAASVKAQSMPQLSVTKQLLPIEMTQGGEKAGKSTTSFSKGDLIRVTMTLVTDRDLDYVLIRDQRGAFMQPQSQLTSYTVEDGLWVLRETRNSATNFYLTHLPKGQYIITYDVYADRDGEYSTGIATAQSQYYPMITAHSAGCIVKVE